jgi:hypothetical protein
MVQSNINQRLNYPETTAINPEDKNKELTAYETKIYGMSVDVCIGKVKHNYESYEVLYAPIYLVKPNGRVTNIGVYEFRKTLYRSMKDSTGELNFYKLPRPLLYNFATIDYISGIVHQLEKNKLDIAPHLLVTLKEREKQTDEYERILNQEMEEKNAQTLATNLRKQYDLSISTKTPEQIYSRNRSRKNRPSSLNL